MQKKISVCIPSYNAEPFIGETIKSVLDSDYRNFEIIVNDDASTDNTPAIVESIRDSRIRFYRNERNVGPVRNWNLAVTKAAGEYVSLLNHDDLYGPFWLTFAAHQLEKNPRIGWVATAFCVIDTTGRTSEIVSRFRTTGEIPREEAFLELAKFNGVGPGVVVRREILEEMGYYDENAGPGADNYLCQRLAMNYPLYYSAAYPHTSWRLHRDNLTHRIGPLQMAIEGFYMLERIFNDPRIPPELAKHKKECFEHCFNKAKVFADHTLRHRDEDTYRKVLAIMRQSGYEG
jgi:glycosyltransferase involved in cell wall biosynthesis